MGWNVAFYGPWVDLGKKTSTTDVMLASHADSGGTFSYAAPAMYPEKIHSLIMPAMMSQLAVVHYTPELQGAALGETLVLLDLLRKPGVFAVEDGADVETLSRFTKGTTLEQWPRVPDNAPSIREEIMKFPLPSAEGKAKVIVDAAFEVKSVGTVVLGLVQRGKISVHDKLTAYPSGAEASIRSIQKQDKNFTEASCGDRVGLALKNAEVGDVPRGTILSAEPIPVAKEFPAKIALSPLAKSLPNDLHLCLGLQWGGVRLDSGRLVSDKAFALDGTGIVAHNAKPGTLRVLGRAEL
jgi:selenocysteine-specific translation elongation factor